MTLKKLTLFSNKIAQQKQFYRDVLGFELIENSPQKFAVQIGQSKLSFEESPSEHLYHYCFLIPCNQLAEAIKWLKQRLNLIKIEDQRIVQHFESWKFIFMTAQEIWQSLSFGITLKTKPALLLHDPAFFV